MNRSIPFGRFALLGLVALTASALFSSTASAFGPACCFCQAGRCVVEVEKEEVDVKCFDVECETICIPPLRFPWECGPLKKCGKVRTIKKLVTDKKKKTVCTYDWSAITCCPDCRKRACGLFGGKGSCGTGCCDTGCDVGCEIGGCDAGCCASTEGAPLLPPASFVNNGGEVIELDQAETVALASAISRAKPDAEGWVTLENTNNASLQAENDLIETTVEVIAR
ncbi:hypothetical protein LOC71_07495 [Rhodopirellula sp. JC740]|uniref:Uncharacterized protein n=1 Tax=Rhodopirellula halodulae TaxID=2894198 RepID=A0ABS8NF12_9BACT|nr:hypothetical protein [Rhodopirellula sp. JC740]MCC9642113.1 hypothetical protein [Rhodopirellula sp. JC740]